MGKKMGPASNIATPAATAGRIQVSARSVTPVAQPRAEGGSDAGVRGFSALSRDRAPGSGPPGHHPSFTLASHLGLSPQPPSWQLRLPPPPPLPALRLSGPASLRREGWPRQLRFPHSGALGCGGDGSCSSGDLAWQWQRWRPRPQRLRHVDSQPTPRPSRRLPGCGGGAPEAANRRSGLPPTPPTPLSWLRAAAWKPSILRDASLRRNAKLTCSSEPDSVLPPFLWWCFREGIESDERQWDAESSDTGKRHRGDSEMIASGIIQGRIFCLTTESCCGIWVVSFWSISIPKHHLF